MHLRKVSIHVTLRNPRRLTWAETFGYVLTLSQASPCFYVSAVKVLWKTVGKENARNEQFLLFPTVFLSFWRTFRHFYHKLKTSANSFSLEQSKSWRFGKGLIFCISKDLSTLRGGSTKWILWIHNYVISCFARCITRVHKVTFYRSTPDLF